MSGTWTVCNPSLYSAKSRRKGVCPNRELKGALLERASGEFMARLRSPAMGMWLRRAWRDNLVRPRTLRHKP